MKTLRVNRMLVLFFLMLGGIALQAQEGRVEVPGDHFSLEGALELFKKSASPEEFEQMLNSAESKVNNLDLNGDGDIDYIKVIDRNEGSVHAFILQAIISETESQDVAVIELEKLANGKAVLQITGDADIYGIETIIEPTEEVRINAGTSTARVVVNVWTWPSVQYVYSPYYSVWISPWRWSWLPVWWSPWHPVSYYEYNPWWESYRPYYSICYTHRVVYAPQIYRPYRNTSVIVYNRHHTQITNYRSSRGSAELNRGRDHASHQNNNTYQRDNDDRQHAATTPRGNSRSSYNNRSDYNHHSNRGRSSTTRDESSYGNRSTRDAYKAPSGWQRNAGDIPRQNSEKRFNDVTSNPVPRKRNESHGNQSNTDGNRTSEWQRNSNHGMQRQHSEERSNHANPNAGSLQRENRQSGYDTRGSQRSTVHTEQRGSSGNPNMQRSGAGGNRSEGGGNKSTTHRRGRD